MDNINNINKTRTLSHFSSKCAPDAGFVNVYTWFSVSNLALWDSCVPSYKQAKEQIIKHKQRDQTRKKERKLKREGQRDKRERERVKRG